MTFKEYFKITKETTNVCLLISILVMTVIIFIMGILIEMKNHSSIDFFTLIWQCTISGVIFGSFCCFFAIITSYSSVKRTLSFYNSMPNSIKENLKVKLVEKQKNPKFFYLEYEIILNYSDYLIFLNFFQKEIRITLVIDLRGEKFFQRRSFEIHKKYLKNRLFLDGLGLTKTIKSKEWQNISLEKITNTLNELINISNQEGLVIFKNV